MVRDNIHNAVKHALIQDGWKIIADPYRLKYGDYNLFADLAAERTLSAVKDGQRIIVEIKTFAGVSYIKEFQQALGQYRLYSDILALNQLEFDLFLAISDSVYHAFFVHDEIRVLVERNQIKLLVVDIELERIVQWTR